ncbi:MAG: MFS transporter [Firmicutes bacterium]|nr:MFS transporter [Bacillota bacterium]
MGILDRLRGARGRAFTITAGATLAATVFLLGYYVLLPVLPMYLRELGWQKNTIGALASVFSISSLVFRPLAGVLTDRSGPTRVLTACGIVFCAVPALFFFSNAFLMLAAGQLLAGACVGTFTVGSNSYLVSWAPAEHMGEMVAWFSIALVMAKGFGSAVGSWLYENGGYGLALLLSAAVGPASIAILAATRRVVRAQDDEVAVAAWPGGAARGAASGGGAGRPGTAGKAAVRGAAGQAARLDPVVVGLSALILISITLSFGGIMTFLPIMAKERGLEGYGYFFVIQTSVVVLVRMFSGRIVDRAGAFWVITVALVCLSGSVATLALARTLETLVLSAVLYGVGYGASFPSLTATVMGRTPPAARGKAFGLYTAANDLGVALGQACAGLSQYTSFALIYGAMALLPFLSIGLLLPLFPRRGAAAAQDS